MKKYLLLFIIIFLFCGNGFALAADRELEIDYPEVGDYRPETINTPLPQYVMYIFNLAIGLGGVAAFVMLVIGGIKFLTSTGSPAQQTDAKEQIISAILGIIILISSYILLSTINPQLVVFTIELKIPLLN